MDHTTVCVLVVKMSCSKSEVSPPILKWKKLSYFAKAPTKSTPLSAGYDLYSVQNIIVPARGRVLIRTDLQIQVPDGCYGRIAPRSGLSVKKFIDVGAGVVDADYTGNVAVLLINHSDTDYTVKCGDAIAQLICEKIFYPELKEVDSIDDTVRGKRGLGCKNFI